MKWLVAVAALLLAVEGLLVVYFWGRTVSHTHQLALAQESRLAAHQTAHHLDQFLQGDKRLLPSVTAAVETQNQLLAALATGGNWGGRALHEPSRVQALSLQKAKDAWQQFSNSVTILTTNQIWKDSTLSATEPDPADSLAAPTATVISIMNPKVAEARALVDGQWLRASALLTEFEADVRRGLDAERSNFVVLIAAIALLDIGIFVALYIALKRKVFDRLHLLRQAAASRSVWEATEQDEIDAVGAELNAMTQQFAQASDFVVKIGEGKLDVRFDSNEKSKLAEALEAMQDKLKSINEEDQRRRWANEGLTQFVDILRSGNDNLHLLGDRVISTLVKYTQSNQGGLYLVEEDGGQKYLELISLFAFNTKKFEQQKLRPGEGLIGQCYQEGETIFLTEIPNEYIRITSGLGGANPSSILIVPLKIDKEIYGIVELAAFHAYQPHEITFVEKLGETIASTLSSVKANQKTRKLLEDFQQQTEQMRAQEEEMRQNMEELTATQEEMTRKEKNYILKIKELEEKAAQAQPGAEWAVATELEKTLRTQLEVLAEAQKAR
jgi:hypothetical protein